MTIKKVQYLLLSLTLMFGLYGTSQAAKVVESLTNAQVEEIINQYSGGAYEDLKDGDYSFELAGVKVLLFHKGKNMQLYSGFKHAASVAKMNDWNKAMRFSRAYIDDEGDPVIESDLDLEGGASVGAVEEFINTFKMSVDAFQDHIGY